MSLRLAKPELLIKHAQALGDLAKIESIEAGGRDGICATAVVRGQEIYIPLEGVIDVDAERSRLDKELAKSAKDVGSLEKRLGNQGFVARAPADVVAEFQTKLAGARDRQASLQEARAQLA
jgi:valyl-tRNA synthetase